MFPASKIHRATELKAPFLQCDKYFHTVTLTELHGETHVATFIYAHHELAHELLVALRTVRFVDLYKPCILLSSGDAT